MIERPMHVHTNALEWGQSIPAPEMLPVPFEINLLKMREFQTNRCVANATFFSRKVSAVYKNALINYNGVKG